MNKTNEPLNREKIKGTYIGWIANEFTKKDLFVAVESVDDKTQQLVDLGLEGKRLCFRHFWSLINFSNQSMTTS